MNLLYSNDRRGEFPDSWYAATAHDAPRRPPLRGETRADVCVVGAGYTGLSAASHLAQAGMDVVLLEAHRAGFGASGRNGGQLGSGQRLEQASLQRWLGQSEARALWDLAEAGKALVKDLIAEHQIDCDLRPGVAHVGSTSSEVRDIHADAELLQREYGYDALEIWDEAQCRAVCPSPAYRGGVLDNGAAHLHPLNYALGLARAAADAGVRIYEDTHVHNIEDGAPVLIQSDRGRVLADHLVLACNGYLGGLERKVAARVMPINNFIVATKPLGREAAQVLTRDIAVADSKFVVNYFRLSADRRLLFGGGESYGFRFPSDIRTTVRKPMAQIFPHLHDIELDYAWGGTLAITMKRMPYLARIGARTLSASGYSGHGVGSATHAGQLMALAIQGQSDGFDTMARIPSTPFPGGAGLRSPLLVLAMTWYAMRDRLGL